jgi:hypothetical protein
MAIKNIPQISGPNFGGVIYSLDLDGGFSSSPSSLRLRVINKSGQYSTPSLNGRANIRFGSLSFNGIIWSYTFSRDAGESTLEVELKDNSVVLDRTAVILWRRGLLGKSGISKSKGIEVNLNEKILFPRFGSGGSLSMKTVSLGSQKVNRSRSYFNGKVGSAILVGTEEWPDSICDIPSTDYTFNDLKSVWGIRATGAPSNNSIRQTYEGTLREVLSSWCSDLGYDFYWDYSSDQVVFYNVASGIQSIPRGVKNSSIISTSESWSMDGSFNQYGIAYTAKPKSPPKELTASASSWMTTNINPIPYSYFLNKTSASSTDGDASDGLKVGKRSARDVLYAGLLGHISKTLRDLWIYKSAPINTAVALLGYKNFKNIDKTHLIEFLRIKGYDEAISSLESIFGKNLPSHDAYLTSFDERISDSHSGGEQELLSNVGRWYKISAQSGTSFYCSSNTVVEVDFSVDPEPSIVEPNSANFAGRKMFDRGGTLSADTTGLQDVLSGGNGDFITKCQRAMPYSVGIQEAGLTNALVQARLATEADLEKFNMITLFPRQNVIDSIVPFSVSFGRSNNPLESTYREISSSQNSGGEQKCKSYEDKLAASQCKSAMEEAREKAMREYNTASDDDDLVSGLVNKRAYYCTVSVAGGQSATVHAPSDSQYRVIFRWRADVKKIDTANTAQVITSVGSVGDASSTSEIRVNVDNVTTSLDQFGVSSRNTSGRATPNSSCGYQGQVSYVFAGEPQGVPLSASRGLSSIKIALGSDGFTTSVDYQTRPSKPAKANPVMRTANSQLNRASFNGN